MLNNDNLNMISDQNNDIEGPNCVSDRPGLRLEIRGSVLVYGWGGENS